MWVLTGLFRVYHEDVMVHILQTTCESASRCLFSCHGSLKWMNRTTCSPRCSSQENSRSTGWIVVEQFMMIPLKPTQCILVTGLLVGLNTIVLSILGISRMTIPMVAYWLFRIGSIMDHKIETATDQVARPDSSNRAAGKSWASRSQAKGGPTGECVKIDYEDWYWGVSIVMASAPK